MTATNHALTGAAIGLLVGKPQLAIPAALVSHFVCDMLPHYKASLPDKVLLRHPNFKKYLLAEAGICFLIVCLLAYFHPLHWLLAAVCAFTAASPDLLHINKFITINRKRTWKPNRLQRFTEDIQWFSRPIGSLVEIAWFSAMSIIIFPFIR